MTVVPEDQRIAELRRLGVSEALVRLASGDRVHETFRNSCLGPPHHPYHLAPPPPGPPFVPLWDNQDGVVGVWERSDGLEFIEYDIEAEDPDEYTPLAHTEQGFWVTQFDFFNQCDVPPTELREAADAVGFRYLDRYLTELEAAATAGRLDTSEGQDAWLQELIAAIDQESDYSS